MPREDRRREIARNWLDGPPSDLDALLTEAMARESASLSDPDTSRDDWDDVADDLLLALSVTTDDDPSDPWNHAGYHARRNRFSIDAGVEFVRAAEMLRTAIDRGSKDELETEEWLTTALASACRCFLRSGRPLAAVAICARMPTSDEAREVREDIEAWICGDPLDDV